MVICKRLGVRTGNRKQLLGSANMNEQWIATDVSRVLFFLVGPYQVCGL